MNVIFILPLLLFQYAFGSVTRVDPLVDANVGLIRGLRSHDGDFSMFMGIPYATVDEANPFGASIPVTSFEDVFEAYYDSTACPQVNRTSNEIVGNLDCLQLNVYVPNAASSQNRVPVMVWIHAGAFSRGESSRYNFGPKYLMKQNVILVTLNYRLGPYGFMCLDIPEVPGNQGMKDQLLAIKWVRDNIQAFGGDVNKITLFGESAGGISVDLHLHSLQDKLFNNVIIQSGSAVAESVIVETDKSAPITLAEQLGFSTDSVNEALMFLANTDSNLLIAATVASGIAFKPCAEKEFDGVEPFITTPWTNAQIPKVKGMPILIGFNSHERTFQYVNQSPEFFDNLNVIEEKLLKTFNFDKEDPTYLTNRDFVHHFYLGDDAMNENTINAIGEFDSDYTYIHPIQRSIKKYLENSAQNVYYYMFSYSGRRYMIQTEKEDVIEGAFHADELGYLFDMSFLTEEPTPEEQIVIDRMTTMWANFAKYSDPTPETSDLLPFKWTPINADNWYYLNINSELSLKSRPYSDRMAFWDLFYKLNEKLQKGYVDYE